MIYYQIEKRHDAFHDCDIYIPQPAAGTTISLSRLAEEISGQCTLSKADCLAALEAMQDSIATHIAQGNSVRLGILGSFQPKMKATSANDPKDITADNVKEVGVKFRPTNEFKARLRATRIAQSPETAQQRKKQ